jgi:hypothetical protein
MNFALADTIKKNICRNIDKKEISSLIFLFLIVNALKITIFNIFIINSDTLQVFMYKFCTTFLLEAIIYLLLFGVKSRIPFAFFYILQSAYIFVNLIYYMYFHSYLHAAQAFALSSESIGAARDLSALMNPKLLIVLLDSPIVIYIIFIYHKMAAKNTKIFKTDRFVLISSCLLVIMATEGWNYIHQYSLFNISKANSSASESLIVQRYGTFPIASRIWLKIRTAAA